MTYNSKPVPQNYITTNLYPNSYYWEQIKKSISAIVKIESKRPEVVKIYKEFVTADARDLGVSENSNKIYPNLAYYACQLCLMEVCFMHPYAKYALEYYVPVGDIGDNKFAKNTTDQTKFYLASTTKMQDNIVHESLYNAFLSNINENIPCPVIDVDKMRNDFRREINKFYREYPQMSKSFQPSIVLQEQLKPIINDLIISINKATFNYGVDKKKNNGYSF